MAFDIFQQAREMNADYYDMHTGYTYAIQDFNAGLTPRGINVSDQYGRFIGFVKDPTYKEEALK